MKIAYILNTYPMGSHTFIRREIAALERKGLTVLRLAMRHPAAAAEDAQNKAEANATRYVLDRGAGLALDMMAEAFRAPAAFFGAVKTALRLGRRSDRGVARHLAYLAEACSVARTCRAEAVQHLHAHFGTNAAAVAMLAGALTGIPWSFTVHGPEEFDQPGALGLDEKMRSAAFTVAISSFGRSQLCRWVDASFWERIKIVHCGIEPARFPAPAPMPGGDLRLICIGRFAEQKGHLLLLDALAGSIRNGAKVHLTMVGDGELRPAVEARIRKLGLADHVWLTGWQDQAGVLGALAQTHALVLPSFAEGLPVVAMEAMAAGRPVLGTYVAGVPELVIPGETGWLVPAGDAQALAQAITAASETSPERLVQMGVQARKRVLARHDIDAEATRLLNHIQAVARA